MTKFKSRTIQSYKEALERIGDAGSYHGIEFDSVFNRLTNYHVCTPRLPPCLEHDLLEGIVAYDIKFYIDCLQKQGWFSYETLNKRIDSFSYLSIDRRDKPCSVSQKKKLIVRGACQIWIFLKLFPLLIEDKIKDKNNEVWACILLLTEIVVIVCAPAIHKSYLPYCNEFHLFKLIFVLGFPLTTIILSECKYLIRQNHSHTTPHPDYPYPIYQTRNLTLHNYLSKTQNSTKPVYI